MKKIIAALLLLLVLVSSLGITSVFAEKNTLYSPEYIVKYTTPDGIFRSDKVVVGKLYTITDKIPTRDGYKFTGWKITSPEGVQISADGTFIMPESDVMIEAMWEKIGTDAPTEPITSPITGESQTGQYVWLLAIAAIATGFISFKKLSAKKK